MEALLQATGLPADLVHHALSPLTHGQGVLVGSGTAGGECGAGAPGGGAGLDPEGVLHWGVLHWGVHELVGLVRGWGHVLVLGAQQGESGWGLRPGWGWG